MAQVEQEIANAPAAGPSKPSKRTTTRKSVFPPRPVFDLAGELSGLKERLGAIEGVARDDVEKEEDEWSERLERLKIGESSTARDTGGAKDGSDEVMEPGATYPITDLDKRLAKLEAALGSDESNVSSFPPSWIGLILDSPSTVPSEDGPPPLPPNSTKTPGRNLSPRKASPRRLGQSSIRPPYPSWPNSQSLILTRKTTYLPLFICFGIQSTSNAIQYLTPSRSALTDPRPPFDEIEKSAESTCGIGRSG